MKRVGVNYELVGFSEIDKYAITSYCAIHGVNEGKNLGDVSKVELSDIPDCDLVTYGFPCQDISVAGLGKGIIEGKTRSGLLFEALRVIKDKKPKYAIAENVKNLVGKKFKDDFDSLLNELDNYGYNNYWKVLNAKEFGIPQNRERVFIVSIRKDIDNGEFEFGKPFDSGLRLKDLLEDEVDEKYYINNDRVDKLLADLHHKLPNQEISYCIDANYAKGTNVKGFIEKGRRQLIQENSVICAERGRYNEDGKTEQQLEIQESGDSNTITTVQKDNLVLEPSVLRYERTEYGKEIRKQYENGELKEKIGNMRELKPRKDGISNTLTTVQKDNLVLEPNEIIQINNPNHFSQRVYSKDGISPTISAGNNGGGKEPCKIVCEQRTDEGLRFFKDDVVGTIRTIDSGGDKRVIEKSPNELQLFTNLEGGKWDKIHESARRVYDSNGLSPTVPTCGGGNIEPKTYHNYKIRKLTPKECWRLMDFSDEDFDNARQALIDTFYNGKDRANSQLYKQAGNSIVVAVLASFYPSLFKNYINN